MSGVEAAKKLAAYRAVDENLPQDAKVVGVGLGLTVVYVAERLGQNPNKDQFVCVPTGFQLKNLIIENGLRLGSIEQFPDVDIAFDGADEADKNLNLIKGGGACLFQEKLVAQLAKTFIVVADYRKKLETVGTEWTKGVPIEAVPSAYVAVTKKLYELGAKKVVLREGMPQKAGPVVTDNNNCILDADFGPIANPAELHSKIKLLVGVVDTGLFCGMAKRVYFGEADGQVTVW